jgi:hypothetical protein
MQRREFLRLSGHATAAAVGAASVAAASRADERGTVRTPAVTVTVDPKQTLGKSRLEIGVTHTQYSLDTGGDPAAITRAKELLAGAVRLHNVHIMGWGTMNPNPAPGVYDWASLDNRMAMVRSIPGAVPVITLCAAPDWMKGGEPGKTVWSRIEAAPLPAHYQDFADLAAVIARRYPDARRFQVWNEMKGMWDARNNNWDYRGYTDLYNRCYDALKAVNRANQVGGPYLVVEGTGGGKVPGNDASNPPISPRNLKVIDYWLQNKRGADFLTLDRGLKSFHDKSQYTPEERMRLTRWFGEISRQVRARPGAADLPFWWAEFYASGKEDPPAAKVALNASAFRHALLGGASVVLLWQPMDTGEVSHSLFSDVRHPEGGRKHPLYDVVKAFRDHFAPGTELVRVESSSSDVEVLASAKRTLLINKTDHDVSARLNGRPLELVPYEVRMA